MRPAPDFFADRRRRAGVPDHARRLLFECFTRPNTPAPLPIELEGIGTVERERRGELERVQVWLDVPPPRPMRPALDGEAP